MRLDPEAQWWQEEAERLNKLCALSKAAGHCVKMDLGDPPALNEDGSLKKGALDLRSPGDSEGWQPIPRG